MSKEIKLLNLLCVVAALGFLAFVVYNLLTAGEIVSTDNLFITMVCLVMALMFAINPLLYLRSEGKLPIPFLKGSSTSTPQIAGAAARQVPGKTSSPMLDAKGRAVPPDVKAIVSRMGAQSKDV